MFFFYSYGFYMSLECIPLGEPHKLRRQLSIAYEHNGMMTQDDPNSYSGKEKRMREKALLTQFPNTGYADGIRSRQKVSFFTPFTDGTDFFQACLRPIIIPPFLIFNSFYYYGAAYMRAMDCLIASISYLFSKPFSTEVSNIFAKKSVDDFHAVWTNLLKSLIYAVASVWFVFALSTKLLSKSVSTLLSLITEPDTVQEHSLVI
jgi:hypothetical protein